MTAPRNSFSLFGTSSRNEARPRPVNLDCGVSRFSCLGPEENFRYHQFLMIYPVSAPRTAPRTSPFKFARSPRTDLCVLYVETLTGVLFWSSDLLGNIFALFVFHLRPSPDHYYYYYYRSPRSGMISSRSGTSSSSARTSKWTTRSPIGTQRSFNPKCSKSAFDSQ